jgi:hypothetical protein
MKRITRILCAVLALVVITFASVHNNDRYSLNKHSCSVELKVNGVGEMEMRLKSGDKVSGWVVVTDDPVEGGAWASPPLSVNGETFQVTDGGMTVKNSNGDFVDMGAPRSDQIGEGEGACDQGMFPARV